ncbi:2Fe-2S iron-sulfur cluster-binding protein [Motiliproteus sediminis]|uniref:2Fe-2S iron-sulfur cluster-binding protein n=1 Tax=Motiliproteus sediminis TaxID=1468178 RepID=UPI001AEFFED0|nr:2Fe-2S iron-sulfur cluster-binding protein [Motiliproteus sediminis]
MNTPIRFQIDGVEVLAEPGQSIMQAADAAGIYIPRLCDVEGLEPQGSCRVCTVKVNGRTAAACTQPAAADIEVENDTLELTNYRRDLVRMLFHEGNHLCPICEASGRCELQAMGYRLGISQPTKYPYLQPARPVDASHPDIVLDTNRCIRCGRCIRASRDIDGKSVFGYVGRGIDKKVGVNGDNLLATDASIDDCAIALETCPVGCIIQKGMGFYKPIGERSFDHQPIGSNIEGNRSGAAHREETWRQGEE